MGERKGPAASVAAGPWKERECIHLLANGLLSCRSIVILTGLLLAGCDAKSLFQELAGLQAVAAGVAFRLHAGLPLRGDRHFDDAGHRVPPKGRWFIRFSRRRPCTAE